MRFKTKQQRQYTNDIPFEEALGFTGKVNFKGGGGGSTVQQTQLDPVQRQALESVISKSEAAFNKGPLDYYPGATLATESPLVGLGQQAQLSSVPGLQLSGNAGLQTLLQNLGIDLTNDPRTEALANAVTQPILDNFTENQLPAISTSAQAAGAFGGDRQALLNSIAARETNRAVGETRAGVYSDALKTTLGNQNALLSLIPTVQSSLLSPAQAIQDVGQQQTQRSQQEIDDARARFEFNQYEPEAMIDRFASRVAGINLGGTSISKTNQSGGGGLFGK